MEEHKEDKILNTEDYVIIGISLAISAGIGIYFRFTDGKQKTKEDYLLAGKNMSILPVAFSSMATIMSSSTLMGIPAEMYLFGTHLAFMNIGMLIGIVVSSYVFVPVYFSAKVSTSYEYIQKRFGSISRTVCSVAFMIQTALYMGIGLYAPALALSAGTNLSTWTSVITIGIVCTFYCTIGGMKAVLWSDMFQAILMFMCLFTIIVKGCIDLGGIENVFQIANEGGRLVIPSISTDFSLRYTMWNVILQGLFVSSFSSGTNQLQVQRLLSVKDSTTAKKAVIASAPLTVVFHLLCCLCGLVFYATFRNCDPLSLPNKPISSADQLIPYYIMVRLRDFPGLPGICICGIFAASLSTVSSCIQTLTTVTIEDFLSPFYHKCNIKIFNSVFFAKALTCFYGVLGIAVAYMIAAMGKNVIQITLTLYGLVGGPLLGLFILAVFTIKANEKGVILGIICAYGLVTWLTFGPYSSPFYKKLPLSIEGCTTPSNSTFVTSSTLATKSALFTSSIYDLDLTTTPSEEPIRDVQSLSYMWIISFGVIFSVILGYFCSLLISYITGNQKDVKPEYLNPILSWWMNRSKKSVTEKEPKEKIVF